jgi:hypothetical protein
MMSTAALLCDVCGKPFPPSRHAPNKKRHAECVEEARRRQQRNAWSRRRKHREQRATTVAAKRLTREEKHIGQLLVVEEQRPHTRGDCKRMPRPCPFVSCKYHLALDVNPESGSIKINFPGKDVDEFDETCALDVADKGGEILERVGELMNLTRERIRQIEVRGLLKLRMSDV